MSLRNEISQCAFINAEIVQTVEKLDSWKKSKDSVISKYSLPEYKFMNPAYVVSLLYCLLVVPSIGVRALYGAEMERGNAQCFPDYVTLHQIKGL